MRVLLATLALAGALHAAQASEPADRGAGIAMMSGADVARAVRCAPPAKQCKRPAHRSVPRDRAGVTAIVDAAAAAAGVPLRLARAVVLVESGFNAHLRGRHGEYGLFQIKCQTARGLGFSGSCAALADPHVNATWGARHVARAIARGSVGFHQAGLHARRVSAAYVAKINRAIGRP